LNCQEVIREISNYLDGDLDASMKREIELHLKDCSECSVMVNQTKLTVDIFCDSELVELPAAVRERLHQALRRKMQESRP
jgi:anti-sigma factor RsiW